MKPMIDDFLSSCAKWTGTHEAVRYELSWHGMSDYSPEGTWCYYLHLNQEQFYPADWVALRLAREDKKFNSSWYRHFDYGQFPDLDPHGGWTFGEMDTYLGRDGKEYEHIKVGCDYAHSWDRDSGYWQGRAEVERDAKHSIDLLCKLFPRRRQTCSYCGLWDDPENFYTARNGALVHNSQREKFSDLHWPMWQPAEAAA
jgi:hypothetical protein